MNLEIKQFYPSRKLSAYFESKSSFEEAWNECDRGDWMLWIARKLEIDYRILTEAKALCANLVRHLMTDSRSTDAVDAALKYGNGEISREEMSKFLAPALDAVPNPPNNAPYNAAWYIYNAPYNAAWAAHTTVDDIIVDDDSVCTLQETGVCGCSCCCAYFSAAYAAYAYADSVSDGTCDEAGTEEAILYKTSQICREVLTEAVFEKVNN
jgi:hypothetical protein